MAKPNFFIVGAPKCGTTAMHDYLGQHPNIFMLSIPNSLESLAGGKKELHYFGTDLNFGRPALEKYLNYFRESNDKKVVGESSVFYLYSQKAASEIKDFAPDAKILIMLRNPVDMIYSWYSQLLFWGDEPSADLETALALEHARKLGQSLPSSYDHPTQCFFYREIAQFHDQVKRYLDIFDPDQVKVIIFDDFKKDTPAIYRETLRFLGCNDTFVPEFKIVNANKTIRNRTLQILLKRPPKSAQLAKQLIPSSLRHSIRQFLQGFNTKSEARQPMKLGLRHTLKAEFTEEVEKLGSLVNRDLTYWSH